MLLKIDQTKTTCVEAARWCIVNGVDYKLYVPTELTMPFCIDVRHHIKHFKSFSGAVKASKKPLAMRCNEYSLFDPSRSGIYKPFIDLGVDQEFFSESFFFFDDIELWLANAMKFKLCEFLESVKDRTKVFAILRKHSAIVRKGEEWIELFYPLDPSISYTRSVSPLQGYDDGETMLYFETEIGQFDNIMWIDSGEIIHISSNPKTTAQKNCSRPMIVNKGHWRDLRSGKKIWVEMYMKRKRMEAKYYIPGGDTAV
jgi:hypothetical protein